MKLYKARELAKLLRVHPKTIYRLGREGKIKRVKTGRAVRFVMPEEE
jgi:excisionase family DNA binding protein